MRLRENVWPRHRKRPRRAAATPSRKTGRRRSAGSVPPPSGAMHGRNDTGALSSPRAGGRQGCDGSPHMARASPRPGTRGGAAGPCPPGGRLAKRAVLSHHAEIARPIKITRSRVEAGADASVHTVEGDGPPPMTRSLSSGVARCAWRSPARVCMIFSQGGQPIGLNRVAKRL